MEDKVKINIVIDRRLWEKFKKKIYGEGGLGSLGKTVEDAIEEEIPELIVIRWLEEILKSRRDVSSEITPIEPRVATDAGRSIRSMRDERIDR